MNFDKLIETVSEILENEKIEYIFFSLIPNKLIWEIYFYFIVVVTKKRLNKIAS